jgi:hypothetical protein
MSEHSIPRETLAKARISGGPDERWDNDVLRELRQVKGSDFEAVDVSSIIVNPDSGQT